MKLGRKASIEPTGNLGLMTERIEAAQIKLEVRHDQMTDEVRGHLRALTDEFERMQFTNRESLTVTYDFWITYDDTVRQFRAIITLLENHDIWADVSLFEKSGGTILVQELIDTLRDVQRTFAERA